MKKETIDKIKTIYTEFILIAGCLFIVYSAIYFVWGMYYGYLLKREGQDVIATVIGRKFEVCYYDIEYEGIYYTNYFVLKKSEIPKVKVGERFFARVLPDKLKYHHESGITPKCFRIIPVPLPDYLQDIEKEKTRIKKCIGSMCQNKSAFSLPELLVVLGIIVAFVLISMYLPMFRLGMTIQ